MISGKNIILGLGTVCAKCSNDSLNEIDLIELAIPGSVNQPINASKGIKKATLTIPYNSEINLLNSIKSIVNYLTQYAERFDSLSCQEKLIQIYDYIFDFTRADVRSVLAVNDWFAELGNKVSKQIEKTLTPEKTEPIIADENTVALCDILAMFKNILENIPQTQNYQSKKLNETLKKPNRRGSMFIVEI